MALLTRGLLLMSLEAITWAIKVEGCCASDKLVLLLLANRQNNDTGDCYPSIARVVAESGLGRRTVIRAIQRLEEIGLLSVVKEFGKVNHYLLHTSATMARVPNSNQCHHGTTPVPPATLTSATMAPEPKGTQKNPKGGVKKISKEKLMSMGEGISCWEMWVEHRLALKKPLTEAGWNLQIENLKQFSVAEQGAAIKNSVRNGWVGLFPKKGDKPDGADVPLKMRYL